jgi:hypothetical protein
MVMRSLIVAACVGFCPWALAQGKGEAPSLETWQAEAASVSGAFPRKLLMVTALPAKGKGEVKFLDIDVDAFNKLSFFKIVDQKSAAWDIKINRSAEAKGDPLPGIIATTGADTVIHAPAKGDWKFLRVAGKKRVTAHSAKPPKGKTPEDIASWILSSLGWDGVVLAQNGDFLLVGSSAKILSQPQIQALAVTDSGDKFALKKDQRKGAGLLSLSENKEGVGVFDIVFLGQGIKEIPAGTKLIIEKKTK